MAMIEVDDDTKRTLTFAAKMANTSEGEIVRRLMAASSAAGDDPPAKTTAGRRIYADYEGHRTWAVYHPPSRVEITDGPLKGESFKTPTGAARAVIRQYNPNVNDNRNGWGFWQLDTDDGSRVWLQAIRPKGGA